jgi:hypothetical protein
MICFESREQIYIYLWTMMCSLGFSLLILNLILKDEKYSMIFIIIACCIIVYCFLICFCDPMKKICCKESIFANHMDLININRTINLDIEREDEENGIRIIPSNCVTINNMNNMNNFTSQYNIPVAKKIIIAENIKII